ncbi:Thiosulfate:glutathione sulfurtransferase [Taenia crassiceps]|uniref:Thiosulfate:glutathione sulfurtransferase n=1 Tax=Taenia crassiceps TaxID=6207 RepID=A0ABR4Q8T2_9CEST
MVELFCTVAALSSYEMFRISGGDVSFNPNIDVKTFDTICGEPKGGQIFDVREPAELDTDGRFPGAVNIPLGEVDSAFALSEADFKTKYGVPKPKVSDDNIIFVCKVGKRSLTACKSVEKYGYKKALNLDGGYVAWKEQTKGEHSHQP